MQNDTLYYFSAFTCYWTSNRFLKLGKDFWNLQQTLDQLGILSVGGDINILFFYF